MIARDGYQGARLADVAREAGLTTGAIYSNFRDKQELFLAAFDRVQQLSEDLAVEGSLEELIESVPAGIKRFSESSKLQILNMEVALLAARDEKLRRHLRGTESQNIDSLAARLREDLPDRRERATLMLALVNGLALLRMFGAEDVSLEGVAPALRHLAGLDE